VFNVVPLEKANVQSFEDFESSVLELRKIMFNTFYTWISLYQHIIICLFLSFADFFNFFFF
jgi:hypothetical protein